MMKGAHDMGCIIPYNLSYKGRIIRSPARVSYLTWSGNVLYRGGLTGTWREWVTLPFSPVQMLFLGGRDLVARDETSVWGSCDLGETWTSLYASYNKPDGVWNTCALWPTGDGCFVSGAKSLTSFEAGWDILKGNAVSVAAMATTMGRGMQICGNLFTELNGVMHGVVVGHMGDMDTRRYAEITLEADSPSADVYTNSWELTCLDKDDNEVKVVIHTGTLTAEQLGVWPDITVRYTASNYPSYLFDGYDEEGAPIINKQGLLNGIFDSHGGESGFFDTFFSRTFVDPSPWIAKANEFMGWGEDFFYDYLGVEDNQKQYTTYHAAVVSGVAGMVPSYAEIQVTWQRNNAGDSVERITNSDQLDRGVVVSRDHGATWEFSHGLSHDLTAGVATEQAIIVSSYIFDMDQYANLIIRSTDACKTWTCVYTDPDYAFETHDPHAFAYLGCGVVLIVSRGFGLVLRSLDDGAGWQLGDINPITFNGNITVVSKVKLDAATNQLTGGKVVASVNGPDGPQLAYSTDQGITWTLGALLPAANPIIYPFKVS